MAEPLQSDLDRFPEYQREVRLLREVSAQFDLLCRECEQLEGRLHRLANLADPESDHEAGRLRRRRAALEQEMLAMMQQSQRP